MTKLRLGLGVAAAVLFAAAAAQATVSDPAFSESTFVSHPDLVNATGFAWAPDGSNRLFVVVQTGAIRVIKDGVLLPAPFATVSPLFLSGENGLIGIAFDPNFVVTRHLYVFASSGFNDQQIIRYTVVGDVGADRTTVLDKLPSGSSAHSGGAVGIGPDGKLYFGIGDNTTPANAEDLTTLSGKIGRANLDGTPVTDNPFVDGPAGRNDHIYALGFRNPFSFVFQPATGLLWVSSVGYALEQVFIVHRGDNAGWGTQMYEVNQPAGFIKPVIKYRIGAADSPGIAAVNGAVRVGGITTFNLTGPHYFALGERITIVNISDPSFATSSFVLSTPSPTSFTMAQPGPDATSGNGNAYTATPGRCVTAGAFYDVTGAPPVARGNYFFGDYTSGLVHRLTLDPTSNVITSMVEFAQAPAGHVDLELGPDSALYLLGHSQGAVTRIAPVASGQAILATPAHVAITEGQPRLVMVRLAQDPGQPLTVSVARASGDPDVSVIAGASLTFDSQNFSRPQPVTVAAGRDLDTTNDTAAFTLAAAGVTSETFLVAVRDENVLSLQLSASSLTIDEGGGGAVSVSLSAQPDLDVVVGARRASGDEDVTVASGSVTFTRASWSTPQMVMLAAAKDGDGADDRATIEIAAAGLPALSLEVAVRDNYVAPDAGPDAVADVPFVPDAGADTAQDGPGETAPSGADAVSGQDAAGGPPDARPADAKVDALASSDDSGCGCRLGGGRSAPSAPAALLLLVALVMLARRRRAARPANTRLWSRVRGATMKG
jgi:MYXO-CTERM domain-containing protein